MFTNLRRNRGRGRKIPEYLMTQGPFKVHRSVKTRLEAGGIPSAPLEVRSSDMIVDAGKRELYVPQVRPWNKASETRRRLHARLTHSEWNAENPTLWEWVD